MLVVVVAVGAPTPAMLRVGVAVDTSVVAESE